MKLIESTFLYRLLKADKILFALISLYIIGVLYYIARQREEFPFLLYGMYSLKEAPQETYTSYAITIGGQEIKYAKLRDPQKEMITSSMQHFIPMLEAGKVDKQTEQKFKRWLMNYCLDMRMAGDNVMNVYRLSCNYDKEGKPIVLKKELVYSYAPEP